MADSQEKQTRMGHAKALAVWIAVSGLGWFAIGSLLVVLL
jgi:hypothetical protein